MTTVVQCPRCELRFPSNQETAHHLLVDHGSDAIKLADVVRDIHGRARPHQRHAPVPRSAWSSRRAGRS
jgi:hypothetical protein